jgi:hypothetical protein
MTPQQVLAAMVETLNETSVSFSVFIDIGQRHYKLTATDRNSANEIVVEEV